MKGFLAKAAESATGKIHARHNYFSRESTLAAAGPALGQPGPRSDRFYIHTHENTYRHMNTYKYTYTTLSRSLIYIYMYTYTDAYTYIHEYMHTIEPMQVCNIYI